MSDKAKTKYDTLAKTATYASGLVKDRIKKDKRLNGNTIPTVKNPGSKMFASDPIIKKLRALKKTKFSQEDENTINKGIAKRLKELRGGS